MARLIASASLAIGQALRVLPDRRAGWPLDVARRARPGRPSRPPWHTTPCGSRCPPPARRNDGSTRAGARRHWARRSCQPMLPALTSSSGGGSRGRGPVRTSCDRSGPPSCRSAGTSGGWTPHHRQGPGRSSAPGSPSVHSLPSCVRSPYVAPAGLDDLPDHVGAMSLGMSAGRGPRRSPPDPWW